MNMPIDSRKRSGGRPGRTLILVAAMLTGSGETLFPQTPPLWGNLAPGQFSVGFRTMTVDDHTRIFRPERAADGAIVPGERSRPVQISVWYPSLAAKKGRRMKFGEYVRLIPGEGDVSRKSGNDAEAAKSMFSASIRRWLREAPAEAEVDELMKTETGATPDAAPAKGAYPVVFVAQGSSQSSLTHSVLCEYIASHGFVVVTVPSIGPSGREMPSEPRGAEEQARDLEFAGANVRDVLHLPDGGGRAIIGFSFGGFASLVDAMRNPDVKLLISLDSNLGFQGAAEFLGHSSGFDVGRMRVPLLHFSQYDYPGLDEKLIDSLRYSDRTIIRVKGLTHFDFSSLGMISAMLPDFVKTTRPEQREGYETVCRYVLAFLEMHTHGRAGGGDDVDFSSGSRGLLAIRHVAAETPAAIYEEFVSLIRTKGISEARRVYDREKLASPRDTLFAEGTINRLGYELLYAYGMTAEAIEVFRWNVAAYPGSFNTYDSLGEAYLANGDRELAIINYRKSLDLNPQNTNANSVLEKIGGTKN
jgi:dienelactone hydrolase